MFYWFLKRVLLGPVLRLLFRPWVEGSANVPAEGGAILASNHLSFSDSIFLPLMVERRVTFLAKSDYFTGRGLKGRLTALFFRGAGQVPMDRSGGHASENALRAGLRLLRRGELLGIYPEGTRSPDGRLYRGKTGVGRMALEGKVPVVPVAMIGTEKVQPIGRVLPHIRRVGIRIGRPLDFSRYEGLESDRFVLRSVTDEIMYELMELSGQEYVDVYASKVKEEIAAARREKLTGLIPRRDGRGAEPAGAVAAKADGAADSAADLGADVVEDAAADAGTAADAAAPDAPAGADGTAARTPGADPIERRAG